MFDRIAHRYDLLNRLLSMGRDVAWRKQVTSYLPKRENLSVLDLATGTADLLISVYENSGQASTGVGVDMAGKMLTLARKKIAGKRLNSSLSVVKADATVLPFADRSYDAVTIAFGIRNFTDVSAGLKEMHRVLNPGGKALILEFSLPQNWLVRTTYLLYFRFILPVIGALISGDRYAYRYLNRTVETFPYGAQFCELLKEAGFEDVRANPVTFGIATIYEGTCPQGGFGRPTGSTPGKATIPNVSESQRLMHDRVKEVLTGTRRDGVTRIQVEIPRRDPLIWLSQQRIQEITFWLDREGGFESAGVGMADCFDTTREPSLANTLAAIDSICAGSDVDVRYYGGSRFDVAGTAHSEWEEFGRHRFVLPRWEVVRTNEGWFLACNLLSGEDADCKEQILLELSSLNFDGVEESTDTPSIISREETPSRARWQEIVRSALDAIERRDYQKIVLARKTSLQLTESDVPLSIMHSWRKRSKGCYLFCFRPQASVAFIGATPERLYSRKGRDLYCEALAGTRPRGPSDDEDKMLGEQLTASEKDIREHRLVVQSIEESLSSLIESRLASEGPPESLLKLETVQHLVSRMKASLSASANDTSLLASLHPTAAVGGYPRDNVMAEIGKLEGFDRGWYSGPVGWIGRGESEFAVAIRSALLDKDMLNVYAGAGIVAGSDAESEWYEIEAKISGFLKVLA
ncbi:MAG: bifunctional demethylmenaquinone methyltransferase/2-methoxy-6-polyprenyl-1,4-benzoquinol methylase UbiE [Candidatus Zixiibacteriota bacterium]|nr:MAG: bifunctional demethylmenaquinone methyltransferase/2-methoxy-6-polyprenyl-1,4-benzoquinol methylase UbiE [candidate division Zixibacteria bacterium]